MQGKYYLVLEVKLNARQGKANQRGGHPRPGPWQWQGYGYWSGEKAGVGIQSGGGSSLATGEAIALAFDTL
eukprot:364305-Chlamydomonas_euryale.AAC.9